MKKLLVVLLGLLLLVSCLPLVEDAPADSSTGNGGKVFVEYVGYERVESFPTTIENYDYVPSEGNEFIALTVKVTNNSNVMVYPKALFSTHITVTLANKYEDSSPQRAYEKKVDVPQHSAKNVTYYVQFPKGQVIEGAQVKLEFDDFYFRFMIP